MGVPSLYIGTTLPAVNRYPLSSLEYAGRIAKDDSNFMPDDGWAYLWGNCQVGDYGYFCAEYYWDNDLGDVSNKVALYKVFLPTLTYVSTIELDCNAEGDPAYAYGVAVDPSGQYLYTSAYKSTAAGDTYVHKVRVSDDALIGACDLSADYLRLGYGVTDANNIVCDDDYVYLFCGDVATNTDGRIVKIKQSDMTFVAVMNLLTELDSEAERLTALTVLDGYLYAGTYPSVANNPPRLIKIDLSDFSFVSALEIDDGTSSYKTKDIITSITTDGTYLYVANEASTLNPILIAKIDPAAMTISAIETLEATAPNNLGGLQKGIAIDGSLYLVLASTAGTYPNATTRLYQIDTSDLSITQEVNSENSTGSAEYLFPNIMYANFGSSRRLRQIHVIT